MGLFALSTHSAGRTAAVKAGRKPVHFSLDGCRLVCYFPGVWPQHRAKLARCPDGGRWTGTFIYALSADENSPALAAPLPASTVCFPAASNAVALPGGNGIFAPTPTERITHYTLQARSCAKGCPFGNPAQRVTASPVLAGRKRGTISLPPIVPLLLSHSACRLPNLNVLQYFLIGCQPLAARFCWQPVFLCLAK